MLPLVTARVPFGVARPHVLVPPHRTLTLVAVVALFALANSAWHAAVLPPTRPAGLLDSLPVHDAVLLAVTLAFGALLALAAASLAVRSGVGLRRIDAVVLVIALLLAVAQYLVDHAPNDEASLTGVAARALLHGRPFYGVDWPALFRTVPLTKTMAGGGDLSYGYPPLAVFATALIAAVIGHPSLSATLATMLAFVATTLLLYRAAPTALRPLVVVAVVATGTVLPYARTGSPAVIAVALLVPVLIAFHRTGASGGLAAGGIARAVCLGAAAATQQLVWFLLPFLLVALLTLRTPDLGARRSVALVLRYAGIAAGTWLVLNAYPVARNPRAWSSALLLPLTDHAIIHGQGVLDVPYVLTRGSGALDALSVAAVLLLAATLVALLLFPGRVGPALAVLPWCAFFLSTRGAYDYFVLFVPLWLATATTVPSGAFERAWRPVRPLPARWTAAITAAIAAPALVAVVVALATPPPLDLTVDGIAASAHRPTLMTRVRLTAVNRSTGVVVPHFAYRRGSGTSNWWRIASGPAALRPGARAAYVLVPTPGLPDTSPLRLPGTALVAVSDGPMTISTVRLPPAMG